MYIYTCGMSNPVYKTVCDVWLFYKVTRLLESSAAFQGMFSRSDYIGIERHIMKPRKDRY